MHNYSCLPFHSASTPDDCKDMLELSGGLLGTEIMCGSSCMPDFFEFTPLTVQFTSSQCCHNCGYFIYASCIPIGGGQSRRSVLDDVSIMPYIAYMILLPFKSTPNSFGVKILIAWAKLCLFRLELPFFTKIIH